MKIKIFLLLLLLCSFKSYSQTDSLKIVIEDINGILKKTVGLKTCRDKNKILDASIVVSKFDNKKLEYRFVYQEKKTKVMMSYEFSPATLQKEFYSDLDDCEDISMLQVVNEKNKYLTFRLYKDDVFTGSLGSTSLKIYFPAKVITFEAMKIKFLKFMELVAKAK